MEKNKCIDNCNHDTTNLYEYDNICYASCPNGTNLTDNNLCIKNLICNNYYNYDYNDCLDYIPLGYYLNDTKKKIIDKCSIKCSNCSLDSVLINLCISCNNSAGYYTKFNDSLNENMFVDCYKGDQFGYYLDLDENIYYPCYWTCKSCIGKGNSDDNQCSECIPNYILSNTKFIFILC